MDSNPIQRLIDKLFPSEIMQVGTFDFGFSLIPQ